MVKGRPLNQDLRRLGYSNGMALRAALAALLAVPLQAGAEEPPRASTPTVYFRSYAQRMDGYWRLELSGGEEPDTLARTVFSSFLVLRKDYARQAFAPAGYEAPEAHFARLNGAAFTPRLAALLRGGSSLICGSGEAGTRAAVEGAVVGRGRADVLLRLVGAPDQGRVHVALRQTGGLWRIDDVSCPGRRAGRP